MSLIERLSYFLFSAFATRSTKDGETVALRPDGDAALARMIGVTLANYAFQPTFLEQAHLERLVAILTRNGPVTVGALLAEVGEATPAMRRALAWLFKFGVVEIG